MTLPLFPLSHSSRRLLIGLALLPCFLALPATAATRKKKPLRKKTPAAVPAPTPSDVTPSEVILDENGVARVDAALSASGAIVININGRTVESDPAPVLQKGSVLVPLRGVLEKLGAAVQYVAAERRIDITQGGKKVTLRLGEDSAIADLQAIKLTAAPVEIGARAFVPMRSLAEIFGYHVEWQPPTRTVVISSGGAALATTEHRAALARMGSFGVAVDFSDATNDEVTMLLDAAKKAGAGFIKVRFDWNTLEPTKGSPFQWPLYDRVVREARERNLGVVGVLGNCTQWASIFSALPDPFSWRNAPPRQQELPAWQNYVRRTVGRYSQDVQAWQVWENPAPAKFRSSERNYRLVVRAGVDSALLSDPKAVIFAAEPGGVNLDFIDSLKRNGLTARVSGVALYPTSQWQPGVAAAPEDFLLPVATLRSRLMPLGPDTRDFWVGGFSRPVVEGATITGQPAAEAGPLSQATDAETIERLTQTFTPQAQADYLMRTAVLALASGSGKVVWDSLRDPNSYENIQPINPALGSGLVRRDGSTRPAFDAFATTSKLLSGQSYLGPLKLGPDAVALVFSDGKTANIAVWPLNGKLTLALNLAGLDPKLPDSLFVASLPDTRVLDSTGKEVFGSEGTFAISGRPVWITNVGFEAEKLARQAQENKAPEAKTLLVQRAALPKPVGDEVRAEFVTPGTTGEEGISWRKFATFRGVARDTVNLDGKNGLKTEFSRNVWNPAAGKPFIYLDIDDNYLFFERSVPVRVTVEVHRAAPLGDPLSPATAGFCLEYDAADGAKRTEWKDLEVGTGWMTYTFHLPNASFSNRGGFDLLINTFGAKQDIVFGSVTLQRMTKPAVAATAATPAATLVSDTVR